MSDPRFQKLADVICDYSISVKPSQIVNVRAAGTETLAFIEVLIENIVDRGAVPYFTFSDGAIGSSFLKSATEEQIKTYGEFLLPAFDKCDSFVTVDGSSNAFESSRVPPETHKWWSEHFSRKFINEIVLPRDWVLLRYPTRRMAADAQMPTRKFEDYYFDVCTLDYAKMAEAMQPLKELMEKTDKVHIKGPGETDISFSIAGIPAIPCDGKENIPDGECFTAPVKDSVNGFIHYNAPTRYRSSLFTNAKLRVEEGKIVEATSDGNSDKLNEIFDSDEGARYFGEFAIAFNPHIHEPMMDILFDEKIRGSFHLTPGNAYEEADNGNKSSVHWDMVCIQRPEYGGGEIYFDDVLIRKDGIFVLAELKGLNPDRLAG